MSLSALSDNLEMLIFYVFLLVFCLFFFALYSDEQCQRPGISAPVENPPCDDQEVFRAWQTTSDSTAIPRQSTAAGA